MQEQAAPAAVDFKELFGERIWSHKDGQLQSVSTSHLDGKILGLYFSAHWWALRSC